MPNNLHLRVRGRHAAPANNRGQGLVEFALALPVLIVVLLIAVDAGRLFYGYVSLHNAARIAANYAAIHADDWPEAIPTVNPSEYDAVIARDTTNLDCERQVNPPVFSPAAGPPRSIGDGHTATVSLTCVFRPLTPIIGTIIGNAVTMTATETFPIRSGMLDGIPVVAEVPTPTPTASPTAPPSASPTASPSASVPPTPRPGECIVPEMIGRTTDQAIADWGLASFKPNKLDVAIGPTNYIVGYEKIGSVTSVWDGTFQNCNSFTLLIGPTP